MGRKLGLPVYHGDVGTCLGTRAGKRVSNPPITARHDNTFICAIQEGIFCEFNG